MNRLLVSSKITFWSCLVSLSLHGYFFLSYITLWCWELSFMFGLLVSSEITCWSCLVFTFPAWKLLSFMHCLMVPSRSLLDDFWWQTLQIINMNHKHTLSSSLILKQAGMSYAQPQAEAVSLNSWLVFPPFRPLKWKKVKLKTLKHVQCYSFSVIKMRLMLFFFYQNEWRYSKLKFKIWGKSEQWLLR